MREIPKVSFLLLLSLFVTGIISTAERDVQRREHISDLLHLLQRPSGANQTNPPPTNSEDMTTSTTTPSSRTTTRTTSTSLLLPTARLQFLVHPPLGSAYDYALARATQPFPDWLKGHFHYNSSVEASLLRPTPTERSPGQEVDVRKECQSAQLFSSRHPATHRACCDYRMGLQLLKVWDAQKQLLCPSMPPPVNSSSSPWFREHWRPSSLLGSSSVACRLRPDQTLDAAQKPVPQNLCTIRNLALNLTRLEGHLDHPPWPREGHEIPLSPLFQTSCSPRLDPQTIGNGMDLWLLHSLEGGLAEDTACLATVEHPVLFMFRWHTKNVYHIHEEFIHTFVTAAMLGLQSDQLQILLTDRRQPGLLYDVWQTAFSPSRPVIDLPDVMAAMAEQRRRFPEKSLLCFRDAVFNVHSGVSLLSMEKDFHTPCVRSPLLMGMSDMILDRFAIPRLSEPRRVCQESRLLDRSCAAAIGNHSTLKRAIMAYLMAEDEGHPWERGVLADPPINVTVSIRHPAFSRQLPHQEQLLKHLNRLGFLMHAAAVEFSDLSQREQLAKGAQSEVLLGVHGAGLIFCAYQPVYGALVEVVHESRARDFPYPSLASMRGVHFAPISLKQQSLEEMLQVTVETVLEVRRRRDCLAALPPACYDAT